jgi:hypothetical protein
MKKFMTVSNPSKEKNMKQGKEFLEKKAFLLHLVLLFLTVFLMQKAWSEILIKGLAPQGNILKLAVMGQQLLTILFPLILFIVIFRLPVGYSLGLYSPPLAKAVISAGVGLIFIIIVNSYLPFIIPPSQKYVSATGSIISYKGFSGFFLTFLTVSIISAAADEALFRGILLRGLVIRYGGVIGVLVTALLTALSHTWEPFKLIHAFIMGIIFAASAVWTKSVYTSFILHALHNSLIFLPRD